MQVYFVVYIFKELLQADVLEFDTLFSLLSSVLLLSLMCVHAGYATVGFNAGDGENYEVLPGSNTADVIGIANTSNVGVPGLWVFQVNQAQNLISIGHACR